MYSNLACVFSISFLVWVAPAAQAKVFLTVKEALEQAFPVSQACKVVTQTRYLTADQMKEAESLSGIKTASALVVQNTGTCAGKATGNAYVDTHRVRTHPETLFFLVSPEGKLLKTEVLSFEEPLDYIAKPQWYDAFQGKKLENDLQMKRAIPFVTGASLTGKATVEAARRILAIDQILTRKSPPQK